MSLNDRKAKHTLRVEDDVISLPRYPLSKYSPRHYQLDGPLWSTIDENKYLRGFIKIYFKFSCDVAAKMDKAERKLRYVFM